MPRKQKRRTRDRRHPQGATAAPVARPQPAPAAPRPGTATGAVEMRLAPTGTSRRRAGQVVLEGVDPAIPLDQVPHFTADLRRIGVTIAVMVVLLVIGSRIIPLAIH
ncbi:MAG: hypothetical protein ACREPI_07635 [Candidatus Dormibacterales bacterium]